jgi:hypothetical protein
MAFGAFEVAIADFIFLRRLDDLPRSQTSRADAKPLDAAVDEGPNRLEVRLEAPRAHIVGVTDLAAHNRTLAADFASFCHD